MRNILFEVIIIQHFPTFTDVWSRLSWNLNLSLFETQMLTLHFDLTNNSFAPRSIFEL